MRKLYKWTSVNATSCWGGSYSYDPPRLSKRGNKVLPGKWSRRLRGKLILCDRGYHVVDKWHIKEWISQELYEVDVKDSDIIADDFVCDDNDRKIVFRQIRLSKRIKFDTKEKREIAWRIAKFCLYVDLVSRNGISGLEDYNKLVSSTKKNECFGTKYIDIFDYPEYLCEVTENTLSLLKSVYYMNTSRGEYFSNFSNIISTAKCVWIKSDFIFTIGSLNTYQEFDKIISKMFCNVIGVK